MSWLSKLLGGRNPTQSWRFDSEQQLVLDLDAHRFCGVGIGDALERLSFLGSAARWSPHFEFPDHGVLIGSDETARICEFAVFFGHSEEHAFGSFTGSVLFGGATLPLSKSTSEDQIVDWLGEAYWRDQDEDETILYYEFGQHEWQVEFGRDGGLKCFAVGKPLLADPQQRSVYGVTKEWPPR